MFLEYGESCSDIPHFVKPVACPRFNKQNSNIYSLIFLN